MRRPWRRGEGLSPAEGPRLGIVTPLDAEGRLPSVSRDIAAALAGRAGVFPVRDPWRLDRELGSARATRMPGVSARERVAPRGTRLASWLREVDVLIAVSEPLPRLSDWCREIGVRCVVTPPAEGPLEERARAFWHRRVQRLGPRVLNLGAGADQRPGAVHLDIRAVSGVDVVGSAQRLPFADASFDALLAQDLLEHFPAAESGALLDEWVRVLRPGGTLRVQTPDVRALARALTRGKLSLPRAVEWLYGAQDHPYNFHYAGFDEATLRSLLAERGIEQIVRRRERVSSKNVCLEGRRGAGGARGEGRAAPG